MISVNSLTRPKQCLRAREGRINRKRLKKTLLSYNGYILSSNHPDIKSVNPEKDIVAPILNDLIASVAKKKTRWETDPNKNFGRLQTQI